MALELYSGRSARQARAHRAPCMCGRGRVLRHLRDACGGSHSETLREAPSRKETTAGPNLESQGQKNVSERTLE